jgi:ATP phosphoribosyltransferase
MTLRIALQKNGRMTAPSLAWLETCGLNFASEDCGLIQPCLNADVELIFVRNEDIPEYVLRGAADFGIVGENVLMERGRPLNAVKPLGFGKCRLVLAVPESGSLEKASDLEGLRIASSYPNTLRRFLKQEGVRAAVIPIGGSVEAAPTLNLAEAICDLVDTGKTLRAQGLRPICTLLESQAVLVSKRFSSFPYPIL